MVEQIVNVIATGVAYTTPILLVAMGENFSERAGVIVLAVEGEMLVAAFCSFIAVSATGNYLIGT
ncbi:MAG: ABC transporter permease, partial [Chloroflexi bacterium]|nr:ABC transporter permease [Chloroflexota bacterium]